MRHSPKQPYRRALFSLLALCFFLGHTFAQKKPWIVPYMTIDVVDTAYLKATYRYTMQDSTQRESHQMTLLVGNQVQIFQGTDNYYTDSLGIALGNKPHDAREYTPLTNKLPKGLSSTKWQVYTGYPKGKVCITDRVFIDQFISEEPLMDLAWQFVADSTQVIMGYPCQLATLELYGRKWLAWYTTEIACPSGPWLLRGLPGLIIQAYDSEHHHDFRLVQAVASTRPIGFAKRSYFKSPRERVIKQYIKYAADPGKVLSNSGLVKPLNKRKDKDEPKRTLFYIPLRRVTP